MFFEEQNNKYTYTSCTCSSPGSITVGKQLPMVAGGFVR